MKYKCNSCKTEFETNAIVGSPKCPKCGETANLKIVPRFPQKK